MCFDYEDAHVLQLCHEIGKEITPGRGQRISARHRLTVSYPCLDFRQAIDDPRALHLEIVELAPAHIIMAVGTERAAVVRRHIVTIGLETKRRCLRNQRLAKPFKDHLNAPPRPEKHTSELQSLMRISIATF